MGVLRMGSSRPAVITLTTDFGTQDPFAGVMRGVIARIAPHAQVVDLTHAVPPQQIVPAAFHLLASAPYFPRGTIHVAVVDPGVGTQRRAVLLESSDALFLAPDNGLLSPVARLLGGRNRLGMVGGSD